MGLDRPIYAWGRSCRGGTSPLYENVAKLYLKTHHTVGFRLFISLLAGEIDFYGLRTNVFRTCLTSPLEQRVAVVFVADEPHIRLSQVCICQARVDFRDRCGFPSFRRN
jgi:hypothetical protein